MEVGGPGGVCVRLMGADCWCLSLGGGGGILLMKITSYNVLGIGGFEKRSDVCRLVHEKNPSVLCVQ
jgi:hypothetical protein